MGKQLVRICLLKNSMNWQGYAAPNPAKAVFCKPTVRMPPSTVVPDKQAMSLSTN